MRNLLPHSLLLLQSVSAALLGSHRTSPELGVTRQATLGQGGRAYQPSAMYVREGEIKNKDVGFKPFASDRRFTGTLKPTSPRSLPARRRGGCSGSGLGGARRPCPPLAPRAGPGLAAAARPSPAARGRCPPSRRRGGLWVSSAAG